MKSSSVEALGAECRDCAVCDHNGRTDSQAVSNGWMWMASHGEIWKALVWRYQEWNIMLVQFATTMGELTHEPWRNTKSSGVEASEAECHAYAVCDHNRRTDSQAISNGWMWMASHGEIWKALAWRHQELNIVLVQFVTTMGELLRLQQALIVWLVLRGELVASTWRGRSL